MSEDKEGRNKSFEEDTDGWPEGDINPKPSTCKFEFDGAIWEPQPDGTIKKVGNENKVSGELYE